MAFRRWYVTGELFQLANDLEDRLAEPDHAPAGKPGRRHAMGAFFGGVRVVSATLSFLVLGIFFTAFDPDWLYDSLWIASIVNVVVAFGATGAAMGLLLLVYPAAERPSLRRAMVSPLLTMLGLAAGVPAALGFLALLIFVDVKGLTALFHHSVLIALVVGLVAVIVTVEIVLVVLGNVAIAVYTCLRHWFGVGNAHPTLPGLATLMCALVQLVLGLYGTFAAQGTVAGIPTGVTFVISVGGPACVGVFALVELRMLAAEGIYPTWVPQFNVGDKVVPLRDDDLVLRHHARLAREAIERAQAEGDAYHAQRAVTRLGSWHADSLRLRGPDHPQTLVARLHLAYWRGRAGDAPAAAAAFTDLVADMVRVLGEDHQHTRAARRNLAHWTRRSAPPHTTR